MDIRLYINGTEADIDTRTVITLNKMFSDLSNPTVVKNTFSKTVSLPATNRNNELFEFIYKVDQIAIDFDPAKRVDFVLYSGGALQTYGYMKLNKIIVGANHEPYQYNVTLYGGLGSFFYTLSEKTLEELQVDEANYDHTINRNAVIESWNSDHYCYMLSYSGKYDNFTSNKIDGTESYGQYLRINTCLYKDGNYFFFVVGGINLGNINRYGSDNYLLDNRFQGLNIQGYKGHLRSIAPRTAPNVNVVTGTPVVAVGAFCMAVNADGDGSFFIDQIDYNLYDVVGNGTMFVAVGDGVILSSTTGALGSWSVAYSNPDAKFISVTYSSATGLFCAICSDGSFATSLDGNIGWYFIDFGGMSDMRLVTVIPNNSNTNTNYPFLACGSYQINNGKRYGRLLYFTQYASINISANYNQYTSINDVTVLPTGDIAYCGTIEDRNGGKSGFIYHPIAEETATNSPMNGCAYNSTFGFFAVGDDNQIQYLPINGALMQVAGAVYEVLDIPEYDEIQLDLFRSYYQRPAIKFSHIFTQIINDSGFDVILDESFFNDSNPYWTKTWFSLDRINVDPASLDVVDADNIRSGASVSFADMVRGNISQLDFILNYCKAFGLVFDVDDVTQTITIKTRNAFFSDYSILDWTEKLDYNKTLEIEPLSFDFATGIFKWVDNGTYYEEAYTHKYNIDYGAAEVSTGYEFDDSEKDLITNEVFINGVISREYDTNFLKENGYRDNKNLPAFFSKDNNERSYTSASMCLLFRDSDQSATVFISDDNDVMREEIEYYWSYDNLTKVESIPQFTRLLPEFGCSLDFGKPAEIYYTGVTDEDYKPEYTAYYRFWDNYIKDIYHPDARVLTAYFYLSPLDMNMFRFNSFIRLENTLWHVNSISDYNITGNNSTKVEMVRVTDLDNYVSGQNLDFTVRTNARAAVKRVLKPEPISIKLNINNMCDDAHNMKDDDGHNSNGSS